MNEKSNISITNFVCILMRGAHIVNIIVYVPWDHVWMLEGNLRCRRISFYTFKLGSIVFFSYVFQAEWPVCFWRFFCLCLLSSLRSTKSRDKYTTVVKFMCILRIQTQELTFITSDLCTETPLQLPPIPVTKRTDPSMWLEKTWADQATQWLADKTHHNELHQTCQSSQACSHKRGGMQCMSCPGTKSLWLPSKSQQFRLLWKTKTKTAPAQYCHYSWRHSVAT